MKRYIVNGWLGCGVAAAIMALGACTTDERINGKADTSLPIKFTVSTVANDVTRAQQLSTPLKGYKRDLWLVTQVTETPAVTTRGTQLGASDVLPSFGISAYKHGQDKDVSKVTPDYFFNLEATPVPNDTEGNYELSQDYYWPASDERLTFYAYAPYGNTNVVLTTTATTEGPQKLAFTVASNVAQQIDLMTAISDKQSPSTTQTPNVPLTFQHQLAGVRFIVGDQFLGGWIKSITLTNVYGQGVYTIGGSWELDDNNKTSFSVSYNTDRPVTGEADEAITTAAETFLMIPQTLGGEGQTVTIVYQDAAHQDYTVKASLTGTWEAGKTYTYAISSIDLTTLRIGNITYPVISGSPKLGWVQNDSIGLYVVGNDGTTLIHQNIKCTYDGTKWVIDHPSAAPIYHLPGQTYFVYYPYSSVSSGKPMGYPEAATSEEETADDFFNGVITYHPIATDQSQYKDFISSDLCIAKATDATAASTIEATLVRKVGLAVINLGSASANKTKVFTNNNESEVIETADVTASSQFSGNTPYNGSTAYYAYIKAGTATSFSSATYSSTNKDAWEESLVFNIAAGASDTKTAYSNRRNWEYVNAVWNYGYSGNVATFTVPLTETYTLEVWGAEGGTVSGCVNDVTKTAITYNGGKGGYSTGSKSLTKNSTLYVVVGGKGSDSNTNHVDVAGGYNGGGSVTGNSGVNHYCSGGGGATHIATATGLLSTLNDNIDAILIVAGGGGGGRDQENHTSQAAWGPGGDGGGLSGGGLYPGTQTGPGIHPNANADGSLGYSGSFGQGANGNGQSGGGGGFYGGATSGSISGTTDGTEGASGGSGYIGGVSSGTTTAGQRTGNGYARITLTRW